MVFDAEVLNRACWFDICNETSETKFIHLNTHLQKQPFELAIFKKPIFNVLHSQNARMST